MRRFIFRFETLLTMRRRHEDDCRLELAAKGRETQRRRERVRRLEEEKRTASAELRKIMLQPGVDVVLLLDFERWSGALKRAVVAAEQRVFEAEAAEEEARQRADEAMRARKILEKLRERHQLRHWTGERRLEQIQLDEIGTLSVEYRRRERGLVQ